MKLRDLLRQFSCSPTTRKGHRKNQYRNLSRQQDVRALEHLEERVLLSSVTGIVFEDVSGDGIKDTTDRNLSGFPVSAWSVGQDNLFGTADDQFVAATRTNAAGQYSFTLTTAANYAVRFGGQIGAWEFSTSPLNSLQSDSSDVDAGGVSAAFSGGGTAANVVIDAGIQPTGSELVRARNLQQTYEFAKTNPTYLQNVYRQNEKWLKGQYGGKSNWYFLLPNGDLYNWDSGVRQATGEYIASLGTAVYANPALLHNALGNIETTGVGPQQLAYDLDTQLHLEAGGTKFGNWYETYGGQGVRWVAGDLNQHGNRWYFIRPDGAVHAWDGTLQVASGAFLTQLGPEYFQTPTLLTNPVRPVGGGDVLGLTKEAFGITRTTPRPALVTTGSAVWYLGSTNQFGNKQYFLTSDGKLSAWNGRSSQTGSVVAQLSMTLYSSPGGLVAAPPYIDNSSFEATAYDLNRHYNLSSPGYYFENWAGLNEKWIKGKSADNATVWFIILPTGEARTADSWTKSPRSVNSTHLANLSPTYYQFPRLLHNALRNISFESNNAAPTGITISRTSIREQQPIGTTIGQFTTTDPDNAQTPQTFTYALVNGVGSTDNGKFSVDAAGNLKTGDVFEFDTKREYSVRVRSTDQGNRFVENVFTVSVASNGIVLQEDSSFSTEILVPVVLDHVTGQRLIKFSIDSIFDRTDATSTVGDRLQVYLVDAVQTTRTLLDNGQPGTALFSLTESKAEFATGLVRFDGTTVEIDASGVSGVTSGKLLFQLLGGDTDSGTRINIGGISNQTNADGIAGARLAMTDAPLPPGGALATSSLTATSNLTVQVRNARFNSTTGEYAFELQARNSGAATGRKVAITFPNLPAGVSLTNASGTTAAGVPYINLENAIPNGGLPADGVTQPVTVKFSNLNDLRLPLRPVVLVGSANQSPVFPAISPKSVMPGQTLTIPLNATDQDGDRVTYSLADPQSMPTGALRANGILEITPELNQLGQYSVEVIASDGAWETRQTISLSVVADPNTTTRISGVVLNTNNQPLAGIPVEIAGFSAVTGSDGSFIITLPTMKVPTEAFNISVPEGDAFLDPFNTGDQEIRFRRARHDVTTGHSILNPRMHPNLVTSFIDASTVYGSDEARAAALRTFADGKLKTSTGNLLPLNDSATFPGGPLENDNEGRVNPASLFASGDVRTNENVALVAMHTVFLREHNRLADEIKASNPSLTDEQIYQKARHQVAAIIQHITYSEYLPLLLGSGTLPAYTGYKPTVDPRESEVFATAAFRIGHTQLTSEIKRLDASGNSLPGGSLSLKDAFFTADPIKNDGIEAYLRGLAATPMQEVDAHVIDDVRNFLFGPAGSGGMDLASMNIQRGRDVGLPSYNQARVDFGLPAVTDFNQITSNPATQTALRNIYGTVNKIDVWVGGIAEDHASGAQVGPLFQAVLKDQFLRSRDGDRFFFENSQFTSSELAAIRGTTLESLIERNAPGVDLPSSPFTTGTQPAGPAAGGSAAGSTATTFRTIDGSGNNASNPNLGATGSHVIRNFTDGYADGISAPAGANRPGAREISNAVVAQTSSIPSASGATSMLVFWGQILDHDLGLTPGGVSDTLKILGNQRPNPTGNEAYPFVAERMQLMLGHETYPGVNNVIARPIYLPVLDVAGGTTISPTNDTTVSQQIAPGETASVFVQAGTLQDRLGNEFSGVLSITEVPPELTPVALPPNLFSDTVVTIQPADMVFTTPAPLTFPNRGGWAPGTLMDLWSINPITGVFDDVGDMKVSIDGSVIETISGGIRNSSWHFPAPLSVSA